nr:NAD(P)/FAD-dependent oxidoreductase [uncultured Cohaesibacter sp.]
MTISASNASTFDIAIIGAGPAGMAAAIEAGTRGLKAVILDEAPHAGGQIYRDVEKASVEQKKILGPDYVSGDALVSELANAECSYLPKAQVWHLEDVEQGFRIFYSREGSSHTLEAKAVLVATGALERPMPLPGWTLPGVTNAGAIQVLMKNASIVSDDLVLVGNGPLLLVLAAQLADAGYPPKAIVEMLPFGNYLRAVPHLYGAVRGWRYLLKGLKLTWRIRKAGIPFYRNTQNVSLEGTDSLQAVRFVSKGVETRIPCAQAALHHGVVPNQQITRLMRCDHHWDESQQAFLPDLDTYGESSRANLYVAGDGGGIRGAKSAEMAGRLTVMRVAQKAGLPIPTHEMSRLQKALSVDAAVRPFLETLYAPAKQALAPADETIICRCEEITAGQIRASVKHNAAGPNQVKSYLRSGMGPCQGRVCGLTVTGLIAAQSGKSPGEVDYFRIRPPLKPMTLSELAEFEAEE